LSGTMVRICPVSIPWFRSKNSGKWAKFAPEFAPVNFPKNGFLPSTFRRPFIFAYGSTLIGRLKMFLVRFPMRAGSKKIDFFQNVPGSIPNCGGIDQIVFSKCSWFDSQLRRN
jgi:hypothetical protein